MNKKIVVRILGYVLEFQAAFLMIPFLVGVIYQEKSAVSFAIVAAGCLVTGFLLTRLQPQNKVFQAREGFAVVSLSWIILSLTGALPFYMSGQISGFINCFFETVSGFTTTGASILADLDSLDQCMNFWRCFTHWIGGMGILVFIMAIAPLVGGNNIFLMKAESPGPSVGKLVPKIKTTAMILYGIYIGMTLLQFILLMVARMPVFDSVCVSLATAGTGGFAIHNAGCGVYSTAQQAIITIFMIAFGINFNVYYLLLCKKIKEIWKNEEFRAYLGIIITAVVMITINIAHMFDNIYQAFHHSAFQVGSIITTTGFATQDFNQWPSFSKVILVCLMFIGASAGSTGGGMKVARFLLWMKTLKKEIVTSIFPNSVKVIRYDDHPVEHEVIRSANVYLFLYIVIFVASILVVSLDGFDLITTFTSVAATINNIGPGLEMVGPTSNFGQLSGLSKLVLSFDMLAGRLELLPMILIFVPKIWKR
jgi:trk system potassium uptake protein TrkH